MKLCLACDTPVPPSPDGKRRPHKVYCSTACKYLADHQRVRAVRSKGLHLLRFMERNYPDTLRKLLYQMEQANVRSQKPTVRPNKSAIAL